MGHRLQKRLHDFVKIASTEIQKNVVSAGYLALVEDVAVAAGAGMLCSPDQ
jgi:hypothetical protein